MNFDLSKIPFEQHAVSVGGAVLILVVGWIATAWIAGAVSRASQRSGRVSPTLIPLISRSVRLALLVVIVLAALGEVGVDTSGLFAMIGAAGLAIGLALKDTVSDVAAGIMLLVLRPFDVGEAVDIGGTSGVVSEVGLFQTKLTSFEGVPIVINNAAVRTSTIQNYTRASTRRTDLEIGIGYGDDIAKAKTAIVDLLQNEPRVLKDPEFLVNTTSLGDSAVVILVRYHTLASDFFNTKLDLTGAIKLRLDQEGVSIPFPQRDLHIIKDDAA